VILFCFWWLFGWGWIVVFVDWWVGGFGGVGFGWDGELGGFGVGLGYCYWEACLGFDGIGDFWRCDMWDLV